MWPDSKSSWALVSQFPCGIDVRLKVGKPALGKPAALQGQGDLTLEAEGGIPKSGDTWGDVPDT